MTQRPWICLAGLLAIDALLWILTLTAQANFTPATGSAVTSLPIVFGWIGSVVGLIAAVIVVLGSRQAKKYRG